MSQDVLLVLTEQWADWEASYAIPVINSVESYTVKTIAVDKYPKLSIGGIKACIDLTIDQYDNFDNCALIILPGGFEWQKEDHNEISIFIKKAIENKIPIAAICGATIFLGKHGILNYIKHTGDDLEYFTKHPNYHGEQNFRPVQIINDQNIVTAHETAALEFAYELFNLLKIGSKDEINRWYQNFKNGVY